MPKENGKIAGVVLKKAFSKEQVKKLGDSLNPALLVAENGLGLPQHLFRGTGT